jgi:hypothetical protein
MTLLPKPLHPRAVLEGQLASAEREAAAKAARLTRARAESHGVEEAEHEAERTARNRDNIAAQLDKLREGESE